MKPVTNFKASSIKNYSKQVVKSKLVSNFFYLSLLQVANVVLPFLIIPHLVQVIGFDKVGIVFMAQALMTYLTIVTDYGFNLTATKFISVNRTSKNKLEFIYNAVISTKLLLIGIAFAILLLLVYFIPLFSEERMLFLFSFTIVLGNTFFPIWFFQGIEEMKYISLMNFISKIIFTVSIFFFINQKADYIKVNLLLGVGNIISSSIAYYIITKKYTIRSHFRARYIKLQLNEGWHIFVSNLAINVYMYSNIFILGIFANKTMLGYFGIADKCIQGLRQVLSVFYQVIYPKACHVAKESHALLIEFYRKVFSKFLLFIIFCSIVIFLMAPFIVFILTKSYQPQVSGLLRMMCFIPIIVALNIPCSQSIIIYQVKKSYSIVIIIGAAINLLSNILLAKQFSAYGTVGAIYITETFITISLYLLLQYTSGGKYSLRKLFSL